MAAVSTKHSVCPDRRQRALTTLKGLSLPALCLLSINLLLYAVALPGFADNPLSSLFQYRSLSHHARDTANRTSAFDPLTLFRSYTVLPALASQRSRDGEWDFKRRAQDGPILYGVFHVLPAIVWSIGMPIQHIKALRTGKYRLIHRICGYATLSCSLILSLSGLLMPRRGLAYRHAEYFHVHALRVSGIPILAWPNFNLQTDVLSAAVLFTGYKTLIHARARDIATHRAWAQLHTYVGYAVPMQRVWMNAFMFASLLLPSLPRSVLTGLNYPTTDEQVHSAELAAFASTAFFAVATVGVIAYRDYCDRIRDRTVKRL